MGMSFMEVQDQLSLFYWMRFGSGIVVVIGALLLIYALLGPRTETEAAADTVLSPAE